MDTGARQGSGGFRPAAWVVALAALAAALAPATAAASSVSSSSGVISFTAPAGETNQVTISRIPGAFSFDDAAGVTAGQNCTQVSPTRATCPDSFVFVLRASAGDLNDTISMTGAFNATLDGQDGDDLLSGGPGQDSLWGGAGVDQLDGGAGDDQLDGGTGSDTLAGADGQDTASYETRFSPVVVTLDGARNDGEAGENDLVQSDVERAAGGWGNDRLTGDAGPNHLYGRVGDDVLSGGGGNDFLEGSFNDDDLDGGEGVDDMRANSGNDVIVSRDTVADNVECGMDADTVVADLLDATSADCEQVDRRAVDSGPPPPPAPDPAPDPAPAPNPAPSPSPDPAPDAGAGPSPVTDPAPSPQPEPGASQPQPDPSQQPGSDPSQQPGQGSGSATPASSGGQSSGSYETVYQPTFSLQPRTVVVRDDGVVPIRISCPRWARGGCRGTLTLELDARALVAAASTTTVGRVSYNVRAGRTATVRVRISRRARRILRKRRQLTVRVRIARRGGGARRRAGPALTLRAPRSRRASARGAR